MIFYSKVFGRQGRGRGNRPLGIWKHGRNKKIRLYVHFNAYSEEFHQLVTIGQLSLGPPNVSYQPSLSHVPHQEPLQLHPNIHEFPSQNANDGWNNVQSDHPNDKHGWG